MARFETVHLPTYLDSETVFRCKLTLESRYKETCDKIRFYLNGPEQNQFFQQSPFGQLVRYSREFNISSQIIWHMMKNQIVDNGSDDLWMVIHRKPVRMSMLEFCLLTGLSCCSEPTDLPKGGNFLARHFPDKDQVFLTDVEAKLSANVGPSEVVDEEKLKMANIFFYCSVLGERTRKKVVKVDPICARLIDDLDRFNLYPWGRVAYRCAVRGLKKDIYSRYTSLSQAQGSAEVDGSFSFGGFVTPLQVLAYEYFPSVAARFATRKVGAEGLPRMFQWVTKNWAANHAPSTTEVRKAFDECDIEVVAGFLTPTPEELISPWYTSGDFVDSAPAEATTRVVELWRQSYTVVASQYTGEGPAVQPPHPRSPLVQQETTRAPAQHLSHPHSAAPHPDPPRSPPQHTSPPLCSAVDSPPLASQPTLEHPAVIMFGDMSHQTSPSASAGPSVPFGRDPPPPSAQVDEIYLERRFTQIDKSIASLRADLQATNVEMRVGFAEMRARFAEMRAGFAEIRAGFAELRAAQVELTASLADSVRVPAAVSRGRKRKASAVDSPPAESARAPGGIRTAVKETLPPIPEDTQADYSDAEVLAEESPDHGAASASVPVVCLSWQYASVFHRGGHALPSTQGTSSFSSDEALDDSLADMYHAPPRPLPYDDPRYVRIQQDESVSRREKGSTYSNNEMEPLRMSGFETESDSLSYTSKRKNFACDEGSKEYHLKSPLKVSTVKTTTGFAHIYPSSEDEDVCPTCLEDYTTENPKILTKCSHHFHLGCIYEWMERSDTCPVCCKVMAFDETA